MCLCVLVCVAIVCGHGVWVCGCVDLSPRSVCIWKGGLVCVVHVCVCAYHKHTYIYTHETSITSGQLKHCHGAKLSMTRVKCATL